MNGRLRTAAALMLACVTLSSAAVAGSAGYLTEQVEGASAALIAEDRSDRAAEAVLRVWLVNRGNEELRAALREANTAYQLDSARKAHQQHGHEGPGGTLRPEDVEQ